MSSPEIQVSETPYPTNPAPTPAPQNPAPSAPPSPSPATSPLNQRASELAELGKARLQQQANDQIARVRAALTRAAGGFFEAGQGLRELQKRGVSESVGYAGFIELWELRKT